MISAVQVLGQVTALRMQSEGMTQTLKSLELSIQEALKAERKPVGPVGSSKETQTDCKCPANQRIVISRMGEPGRTQCRICEKEHGA